MPVVRRTGEKVALLPCLRGGLLAFVVAACSAGGTADVSTGVAGVEQVSTTVVPIATVPDDSTTTTNPPESTITTPDTTTPDTTTATTVYERTDSDGLSDRFVPEVAVENGTATLAVPFVDGSTLRLRWPADLDLVSEGVTPHAWGSWPECCQSTFFIRRGTPAEVVGRGSTLLGEYDDGKGGQVGFWRPESLDELDYLAFQFDSWVVLVSDFRPGGVDPPMMSDTDRQTWATNFDGQETDEGFLRLSLDPPLELTPAGGYPSPMSLTLRGPDGSMTLTPEEQCIPGFIDEHFHHWCDPSGLLGIRVDGTPVFEETLKTQLRIDDIHLVGITD